MTNLFLNNFECSIHIWKKVSIFSLWL